MSQAKNVENSTGQMTWFLGNINEKKEKEGEELLRSKKKNEE